MVHVSKYRAQIMAVAIMIIIYHHVAVKDVISYGGYVGVEMFFLLSGIGLTHSMMRSPSVFPFWKKRALRLIPTYLAYLAIGAPICFLWKDGCLNEYLDSELKILDIFELKQPTHWFLPAIVLFYMIFPAFFLYANRKGWGKAFLIFAVGSVAMGQILQLCGYPELNIMFPRFASGFCGAWLYHKHKTGGKPLPRLVLYAMVFLSLASAAVMVLLFKSDTSIEDLTGTGVRFIPSFILGISLCYIVGWVSSLGATTTRFLARSCQTEDSTEGRHGTSWHRALIINTTGKLSLLFSYIGGLTLEIYLLDEISVLREIGVKSGSLIAYTYGISPGITIFVIRFSLYLVLAILVKTIAGKSVNLFDKGKQGAGKGM